MGGGRSIWHYFSGSILVDHLQLPKVPILCRCAQDGMPVMVCMVLVQFRRGMGREGHLSCQSLNMCADERTGRPHVVG